MSWRSWSLSEWNTALVTAVFLDQERLGTPISRINASDRFLATCTKDARCVPSEARRAFVTAFGKTTSQIKSRFIWSDAFPIQTARLGIPPIFAQLYLTLLAASADDATYDQGDFRKRFAELVKLVDAGPPNFSDLPTFWLHVQGWSKERARKTKDCRILQLPEPPQHERLIGHSKRLAFPAYKDETRLQRLLQESNLDGNSDFRLVTQAVYSRLSSFTANFVEELNLFKKLVADAKFLQAYESPFWGAVRDISWEDANSDALKNGSYCLGIEIIDPSHPELYLLTDSVGRDLLSNLCRLSEVQSRDKYTTLATSTDGRQWTPQMLDSIGRQNSSLRRSKLWKDLACGCIVLFPDTYGNLTSQGNYFDDCAVCFILQDDFAAPILSDAKFYGPKPLLRNAQGNFGNWQVLLFESISRDSLMRLVQSLPHKIQCAVGLGWRPPRPSLSGGAWFGQALLLNPASNPLVCMLGAISGEYELIDASDSVLISGRLDADDLGFRIPSNKLVGHNGAAKVRFILQGGADNGNGEIAVPLVTDIPLTSPILIKDRESWLADGRAGVLAELSTLLGQVKYPSGKSQSKRIVAHKTGHPRLQEVDQAVSTPPEVADLDDVPDVLEWLCEALSLRFQQRTTLPFKELNIHISTAAKAVDVLPWLPRRLLFAAGWLSSLQKRTSPYSVTAPGERTIAIYRGSDKPVVRIVGMLSRSERAKLRASLIEGEAVYRLRDRSCTLGLGAIELQLHNPDRVEQIASQFSLTVLLRESFGLPIAATRDLANLSKTTGDDLPSTSELQMWHEPKHEWVGYISAAPIASGTLIRLKGEQRYTYWAFGEGIYWKTDSDIWARIFKLAVKGKPVGQIATNGDCRFHSQLMGIPQSLSRWWMHWGGGCISIDATGSLVFGGGCKQGLWDKLVGWNALANSGKHVDTGPDMALGRRNLALRLRALRSR